jgi:hypothetical protein
MQDRNFSDFHIAGFNYYDAIDVFYDLRIGTPLSLKAEPQNPYDPAAVAIYYQNVKLGFVPRTQNEHLSKFLNLGHTDLFECKINQINPDTHPEKQVRVVVRICEKK